MFSKNLFTHLQWIGSMKKLKLNFVLVLLAFLFSSCTEILTVEELQYQTIEIDTVFTYKFKRQDGTYFVKKYSQRLKVGDKIKVRN